MGRLAIGERKAIVGAEDRERPSLRAAMDAASVCRKFESSRRRDNLSFKHHREVAALPAADADALLDWCEEIIQETGLPSSPCIRRIDPCARRRLIIGLAPLAGRTGK
jgi:hypothetical protein